MSWFALVRHEDPQTYPNFPREGVPISIHTDKNWWGSSVDGKNYKVVEVSPINKLQPVSYQGRMTKPLQEIFDRNKRELGLDNLPK